MSFDSIGWTRSLSDFTQTPSNLHVDGLGSREEPFSFLQGAVYFHRPHPTGRVCAFLAYGWPTEGNIRRAVEHAEQRISNCADGLQHTVQRRSEAAKPIADMAGTMALVAESGRASGRAQLLANFGGRGLRRFPRKRKVRGSKSSENLARVANLGKF